MKKTIQLSKSAPFVSMAVIAVLFVTTNFLSHIQTKAISAVLLLALVIFAGLKDGMRSAIFTALITQMYFLFIYATPGKLFHYTDENLWRVITIGSTLSILALLIGFFRKQINTLFEKEHTARLKVEHKIQKLRKSEERKEEFISMASHELKTPITSIKLGIHALSMRAKKENNEHLAMHLARMDEQVNNLTRLVNDLLDVSKMSTGKLLLNKQIFDINALIDEKIDEIQRIESSHHIIKKGRIVRQITADRARIGQVLINLLTNAIRYSPHADSIIVQVTEQTDHILIRVTDFGIGIAKTHQKKIFNRFYQVNSLHKKGALGIGLYICSQIIKLHNGSISVESQKGEGATFTITLPLEV